MVELVPRRPEHAAAIFAAIDSDRERLRRWFDWVDACRSVNDVLRRQPEAERLHRTGELFEFVIVRAGAVVGKADVHSVSQSEKSARIGYWIVRESQGKGIVTEVVRELTRFGFEQLDLDRLEIWTTAENLKSQGVALRAGFEPDHRAHDEADEIARHNDAKFILTRFRWQQIVEKAGS